MTDIKAIIADDEEPSRSYIKSLLMEVWPELKICGEAENGIQALALIEKIQPDIVFLDIQMPGLSGMQVAQKVAGSCRVVFITAYDEYAVEAFENEALDYIMKPTTTARLTKTVERIKSKLLSSTQSLPNVKNIIEQLARIQQPSQPKYLRWIKTKSRNKVNIIPVDRIYFFQSDNKYTKVATKDSEYLIRKSINDLAIELDPDAFWRIHRGTIINAALIDNISTSLTGRGLVRLKNRPELHTVSRSYASVFKHM